MDSAIEGKEKNDNYSSVLHDKRIRNGVCDDWAIHVRDRTAYFDAITCLVRDVWRMMPMNKVLFSSERMDWETPDELFEELNKEFAFTLDAASSHSNAKTKKHFTVEENGLLQNWGGETVWVNPPYGKELPKWIEKAAKEGTKPDTKVVMLIPARTDTRAFHEYIYKKAEIRFLKGRLTFKGAQNNAPFPSMVVIFGGEHGESE